MRFLLLSFSLLSFFGSSCFLVKAQVPDKITDCNIYFSDEVNTLLNRDASKAIVTFSFQDDKKRFFEFYQKLRAKQQRLKLEKKSNLFSKALDLFKIKKNELTIIEQQEIDIELPEIMAPREMFGASIGRRAQKSMLVDGDIGLVPYGGHPDTNELELRDLKTGRLLSYLEWDEPDFGMFEIDDFVHYQEEKTVILRSNSFFGRTKEASDKDIFYRWNYENGQTEKVFIDRNFQKSDIQASQGGSRFSSQMNPRHPYFLRGSSPVSDGVNVQIINYQSMRALAIEDASFETYKVIGYNQSYFNSQLKYMLYLQKGKQTHYKKSFVLLPFEYIEDAMQKREKLSNTLNPLFGDTYTRAPLVFEHSNPLHAVKASPCGELIISATVKGEITLWSASDAQKIKEFTIKSSEAQIDYDKSGNFASIFDRKDKALHIINLGSPNNKLVLNNIDFSVKSTLTFLESSQEFFYISQDQVIQHISVNKQGGFDFDSTQVKLPFYQSSKNRDSRNQKMFLDPSGAYLLALSKKSEGFNDSYWLEAYNLKKKKYLGRELLSHHSSFASYTLSDKRDYLMITTKSDEASVVKIPMWIKQLEEKTDKL